ncbi:hypothetical protein [Legionella cardiaca]|uniref:Uncharacterized protein n=1 Tax=Legionella cardiaca TaxID=1071983 RepID=A0ABY8AXW8_9GAMM|nr:hypothetical protein [Legionella cardiaca]WED44581.1 hypothetical protein PXX05_07275 [Legionella cardiaca]
MMKGNLLIGFMAAMSFANMSHADFTFHSNVANVCKYLAGHWSGKGKASSWLIGDCLYHGAGVISEVDNDGHFTVEVKADKDSGSFFCPKHSTKQLTGICTNGVATIMTEYGNLQGNFSQNAGSAKGTLTVAPGINAEITIEFQRLG